MGVSVITEAGLRTGAAKSTSAVKALRLVANFLRPLGIIEFISNDALRTFKCAQSSSAQAHSLVLSTC
jgi:predicted nucleic acid-binding protein